MVRLEHSLGHTAGNIARVRPLPAGSILEYMARLDEVERVDRYWTIRRETAWLMERGLLHGEGITAPVGLLGLRDGRDDYET